MRHLVVGTAGHIDHGKTSLVRALTGTDPDRLAEEKRRGITIELGFANLALEDQRVVSFVDVPGHERFVRHMVAGATGIDAVLLVVAADRGVEPQTREHLAICRLLGVRDGVVALTKSDLVEPDLRELAAVELRELLAGTFLGSAAPIAVSSRTGEGLADLVQALGALFSRVARRPADGVPRLPIDRSFVLRGFGTVVTGTVASGRFAPGDEIEILPTGRRARIRGLEGHGARVNEVEAGQRAALNLQGVDCEEAPRGATVTTPGALATTRRIWARIELLESAPSSVRRGGAVRFHQGTCERDARFRVLGPESDGAVAATIHLAADTVLAPGDRFILRRPAPVDTIGGGTVVDVRPPRSRHRLLGVFGAPPGDGTALVGERLARAGARGRDEASLAAELGLSRSELAVASRALAERGEILRAGSRWFAGSVWRDAERLAIDSLERLHAADRLRAGIPREELRAAVDPDLPQDAWRTLLDGLTVRGRVRCEGDKVALTDHEVVLSAEEDRLARQIEGQYARAGLDPPDWDAVASGEDPVCARRVTEWLVAQGALVRIPDGRFVHSVGIDSLRERLREYATRSRTIDVAAFKDLAGVTRKNAIPLLEYLDAIRATRRVGNLRQIL